MATTTYIDGTTTITADTMNDLDRLHYTIFEDPADKQAARKALAEILDDIGRVSPPTAADQLLVSTASGEFALESAGTLRTSLGLAIGTDVQAWDTNLDQIAALTPTDSNIIVGNGSAWVAESGATARTSLGVAIGTDVQAWDDDLDDLAALTHAKGNVIASDGTDWSNLTVGNDNELIVADSGQTLGIKWTSKIVDIEHNDYSITHATPSSSSGSLTIDYSTGNSFKVTLTEDITSITISNPPPSGTYGEFTLTFVQDSTGSWAVSGWPAAVKWPDGTAPTITTTATTGTDKIFMSTDDGGTTWLANFSQDYQ